MFTSTSWNCLSSFLTLSLPAATAYKYAKNNVDLDDPAHTRRGTNADKIRTVQVSDLKYW
jgi:hypothetical protein